MNNLTKFENLNKNEEIIIELILSSIENSIMYFKHFKKKIANLEELKLTTNHSFDFLEEENYIKTRIQDLYEHRDSLLKKLTPVRIVKIPVYEIREVTNFHEPFNKEVYENSKDIHSQYFFNYNSKNHHSMMIKDENSISHFEIYLEYKINNKSFLKEAFAYELKKYSNLDVVTLEKPISLEFNPDFKDYVRSEVIVDITENDLNVNEIIEKYTVKDVHPFDNLHLSILMNVKEKNIFFSLKEIDKIISVSENIRLNNMFISIISKFSEKTGLYNAEYNPWFVI